MRRGAVLGSVLEVSHSERCVVVQNPTGSTVPLARKAEIYALCQEFDLVLLEDDAYYTLQFPLPSGAHLAPLVQSAWPDTNQVSDASSHIRRVKLRSDARGAPHALAQFLCPSIRHCYTCFVV